jgi:hypothetical protein
MPIVPDILRTWRDPGRVIAQKLADGPREDRALATLMGACALIFVAQWPGLARQAHLAKLAAEQAGTPLDQVPSLQALMGASLLAVVFMAPLAFYLLAAISHGIARVFGGKGSSFGARMALFWALLSVAPAMLFHGLLQGFIGPGPATTGVGALVALGFVYVWIRMLIKAES